MGKRVGGCGLEVRQCPVHGTGSRITVDSSSSPMALKCGAMVPKCGRRRAQAGSGQGSVGCVGVDSRGANQKVSPREGST